MNREERETFDALAMHIRIRLQEEARKIATNNGCDYDKTLTEHFKFYLKTQREIWNK